MRVRRRRKKEKERSEKSDVFERKKVRAIEYLHEIVKESAEPLHYQY